MSKEISLCMIVRNEEENLERCLNSIKTLVDEFIIVDTGSTDNTVELALNYGCKVYHYDWNDNFSNARNESLKFATKDYILIMDGDDELDPKDITKFIELKDSLDNSETIYYFQTVSYLTQASNYYTNSSVSLMGRLFPNNKMYYYENALHEQLKSLVTSDILQKKIVDIHILHYGYLENASTCKNKFDRNVSILKSQIEAEPKEPFHYFNLGTEYCSIGNFEEALKFFLISYESFEPSRGYSPRLLFKMIICYYDLNKLDECFELIDKTLLIYPKFSDIYYLKGVILLNNYSYSEAIDNFTTCIELGPAPPSLLFITDASPLKSYDMISRCYEKLNNYTKAFEFAEKSFATNPQYTIPLYNMAKILKQDNLNENHIEILLLNFFKDTEANSLLISDIFYMSKLYNLSIKYVNIYESNFQLSEESIILKSKLLLKTRQLDQGISCTLLITPDSNNFFDACKLRSIGYLLNSDYILALKTIKHFSISSSTTYQQKVIKVITECANLLSGDKTNILCDFKDEAYTNIIFEVLDFFLCTQDFDRFETLLNLLNLIEDSTVLLRLAKLYYEYGYTDMAKREIFNSIKHFDLITKDITEILLKCL